MVHLERQRKYGAGRLLLLLLKFVDVVSIFFRTKNADSVVIKYVPRPTIDMS